MQICPSILEPDADSLVTTINRLSPFYKYFQIDIADGIYVPNKTVQIEEFIELLKGSVMPDPYITYPHSTGHGVGLQIHEYPKISFTSTDVLLPNQVVTVEPGVYLEGKWGMRVEDTVLIKERNEIEVLTKFTKKLWIIK